MQWMEYLYHHTELAQHCKVGMSLQPAYILHRNQNRNNIMCTGLQLAPKNESPCMVCLRRHPCSLTRTRYTLSGTSTGPLYFSLV